MNAVNTALLYEKYRLKRLHRLKILDTPPEERFDRLTRIARDTFGTDIALVTLIDADRQWFKSRQGIDIESTARAHSFCDHAIRQDEVFLVEDARQDPRFSNNPMVVADPGIRFYAGAPIREPGGLKVGTLCIVGCTPRSLSEEDSAFLRDLAYLVEVELERDLEAGLAEGILEPSALKRSVRICHREVARNVPGPQKLSVILEQLVSLTASAGGFVIDASEMRTDGYLSLVGLHLPPRGARPDSLWQSLRAQRIALTELMALLDGEHGNDVMSFPLLGEGNVKGVIVLLGRRGGYPNSYNHELSPLVQLATAVMERLSFRAVGPETLPQASRAGAEFVSRDFQDRRDLYRLVAKELQRAGLRGGSVSICWLDVDAFAEFNETYGTETGDRVLCQIASRLRNSVRSGDVVAAAGGDEFALLLRDVNTNASYARIIEVFSKPFEGVAESVELSGSMGVSVYPQDLSDAETLLRHAEQAMCLAKEEGRGHFKLFDIDGFRSKEKRGALVREIECALDNHEFELFLQPKISLRARKIEGFEALIRWHHPERGLLTPNHFLPVIESSPLEQKLGAYVLRAGMNLLEQMRAKGLGYSLSVNLSPAHFLSENFLGDMNELLSQYPAALRGKLTLEILETTAWGDQDAAARVVRECKQLGVSVSLDDFGTGFSSLSYFRKLPLDEIKIDKSFVLDMLRHPEDQMIVESIIDLAKRFGRRVVAEGVESEAVAERLEVLGCDIAQGYFYSCPRPYAEILAFAATFENKAEAITAG